jgi:hypothetical protein
MNMGSDILKKSKLPEINAELYEMLRRTIFVYTGKKGNVKRKTIEEIVESFLETGHMSNAYKEALSYGNDFWEKFDPSMAFVNRLTTQEAIGLTEDKFFPEFDIQSKFYLWDKISTKQFNEAITKTIQYLIKYNYIKYIKITTNLLKTWRKKVADSGRLINKIGTDVWVVQRECYTELPDNVKNAWEDRIKVKGVMAYDTGMNKAQFLLSQMVRNKKYKFEEVRKMVNLPENKTKKLLVSMKKDKLLKQSGSGSWIKVEIGATSLENFKKELGKVVK